MTARLLPTASALLLLAAAPAALARQTAPAAPDASTSAAAVPVNDQAAQDRIMALVTQHKCGAAKAEATRVGDVSLAEQIGTMCGAHSSNPFPTKSGGGSRGGASGGGRGRGG